METKDKLKLITAWDVAPALVEAELDHLIEKYSMADAEGLRPEDVGWDPTYDLYGAAAEAWLIKAGRASSTTETGADPLAVTSRVFANCMAMSRRYARKRAIVVNQTQYTVSAS